MLPTKSYRRSPMPRKPRIGIPGFYHVLNRGVERRTVFEEPIDYKKFETLLKKQIDKPVLSIRVGQEALAELEKASTLVEASMEKESPDPRLLERIRQAKEKKERNALICKAYTAGHSQHQIAEVLGISQPAVHGIIRRSRRK